MALPSNSTESISATSDGYETEKMKFIYFARSRHFHKICISLSHSICQPQSILCTIFIAIANLMQPTKPKNIAFNKFYVPLRTNSSGSATT